ncbi:unnamed protein product, partial [Meganyctiphanes norvegica]
IEDVLNITHELSKVAYQLRIESSYSELSIQVNELHELIDEARIAILELISYIGQTGIEGVEATINDIENILEIWSYGSFHITLDTVITFKVLVNTIGKSISVEGPILIESENISKLLDLVHESILEGYQFTSPVISNSKVISNLKNENRSIEEIELFETFGLLYNTYSVVKVIIVKELIDITDSLYLLNDVAVQGNDTIDDLLFDFEFESLMFIADSNDKFSQLQKFRQFTTIQLVFDYHSKILNIINNGSLTVSQSRIDQIINRTEETIQYLIETTSNINEYTLAVSKVLVYQDSQILLEEFTQQFSNWLFPNITESSTTAITTTSTTSTPITNGTSSNVFTFNITVFVHLDIKGILLELFKWSYDSNSVTTESIVKIRHSLEEYGNDFDSLLEGNDAQVEILKFLLLDSKITLTNLTEVTYRENAISNAKIQNAIEMYYRAWNILISYQAVLDTISNSSNVTNFLSHVKSENMIKNLFNATSDIIQNWEDILHIKPYGIIEVESLLNEINKLLKTFENGSLDIDNELKDKISFLQNETNTAVEILKIYYIERKNLTDILHRISFITQLKSFAEFSKTLFNVSITGEGPTTSTANPTVEFDLVIGKRYYIGDGLIGLANAYAPYSNISVCNTTDIFCFIENVNSTLVEIDIVTADLDILKFVYYEYIESVLSYVTYSDNETLIVTDLIFIELDSLVAFCDVKLLDLEVYYNNFEYSIDPSPYYEDVLL